MHGEKLSTVMKVHQNQATRPEWAHRLGCWSCETYMNMFQIETPEHALITCPMISHVREEVLRKCGLSRQPQQTTHTHPMWGHFLAMSSNKSCTFLGNLTNNLITAEILKARNYRKIDHETVDRKIKEYYAALTIAKPNGKVAKEIVGKNLGAYFQNPRPPEVSDPQ